MFFPNPTLLLFSLLFIFSPALSTRPLSGKITVIDFKFIDAPQYQNGRNCPSNEFDSSSICNPSLIHVCMTLDPLYLRGTIAAIHSVLKHSSCPQNIFFHFITTKNSNLGEIVSSVFPFLRHKVYIFEENLVNDLISASIRPALEHPLNYARSYLSEILEPCVKRVIYLDSDVITVDDIQKLWQVELTGSRAVGAPEYCQANFTKYFTDEFWGNEEFSRVFKGKKPCYFNTGVMVMDLERWRGEKYTEKIENWMRIQKERKIYELGSLPPFLLVFGGEVEGIEHRWNQHGLGGDNVVNSCRNLHPGPVSLIHWSGKGKPWRRLDEGNPCPIDSLWVPYDLRKL